MAMADRITHKRFPLNDLLAKKARLLALAGDPTRIRILAFMFKYRKACVSDIAEGVGTSVACISHHLQVMRDNGFFTTERMGQSICYILAEGEDIRRLERIVCGGQGGRNGGKNDG